MSPRHIPKSPQKMIEEKTGLNASAYMGLIMAKHRGKIDGKKVMELLKRFVK